MPPKRAIFVICSLGLLAMRLLHVAILNPFIAHSTDDWNYLTSARYIAESGNWTYDSAGRPFTSSILGILHLLFPGRFQMMYYAHQLFDVLIAIGIFYIVWRLMPRKPWFAFIYALVYLLYIPADGESITGWLVMGTWGGLFMVASVICLLEFYIRGGTRLSHWLLVILSAVFIFIAGNIYEGSFLMMSPIPLLFMWHYRFFDRGRLAGLGVWYAALGLAFAIFILPFLGIAETSFRDSSYQENYSDQSASELISLTGRYFENSFPLKQIFVDTHYTYLLIPLLSALVFALVTWRLHTEDSALLELPHPSALFGWIGFGLALIFLGAFPYIYSGFGPFGRALDYAVVGQALVVTSALALVGIGLQKTLSLKPTGTMGTLTAGFLLISGQWFYDTQAFWGTVPSFEDKTVFIDQLTALVPHLKDDTLVLLHPCVENTPVMPWYATSDLQLSPYLYGEPADTGIQISPLGTAPFEASGISIDSNDGRIDYDPIFYRYDQMVIIGCDGFDLYLMDKFPVEEYGIGDETAAYNPYARIIDWERASPINFLVNR
jgi:hypothetical protein